MDRSKYLKVGEEICKELVRLYPIRPAPKSHEGRTDATITEKDWISRIKNFTYAGEPVKLLKTEDDDRVWVDFAFLYSGEYFPVNFKSGIGRTADNISGLKYIRYLLFYDVDSEFNVQGISEESIAKRITSLLRKEIRLDTHNRDYFCISHCSADNSVRIIPVGSIAEEDLATNPKNLFQVNFHTCRLVKRDLRQMVAFVIKKFIEYQKKRADGYRIFTDAGFTENSKIEIST